METKANHILIGDLYLIGHLDRLCFCILDTKLWHGYDGQSLRPSSFKGPVTGLAPASTVLFNGLKVGKIEQF